MKDHDKNMANNVWMEVLKNDADALSQDEIIEISKKASRLV
jgi:hypothetical protein